ncbi:MAG TPA: lipocalin-like domain-containing protein [Stellaceae bacterium]|nr:lipocalin-like domain-containing protein [Stellaceae bacterium]
MIRFGSVMLICLAISAGVPVGAVGQTAKDLVGSWTLVSAVTEKDGAKSDIFGATAKGVLVFDAHGRYTFINPELPKFVANNRKAGTPDENKMVIAGTLSHFGTYNVDEADRSFTFHIECSTYPNWNNTTQRRAFSITGTELTYTDPNASAGGRATVIWRRAD